MKIFQVLEFNQFNTGSVHQMFQASSGLQERGHEVTIVSRPDETLARKALEAGVRFHGFPFRNPLDLVTLRRMHRLLSLERPDVIHAHKGLAHSMAMMASWRRPAGAFVVNRGVSFPLDRWNRGKYRSSRVDRVVTVCEQIKDVIVASGGLPSSKVEVVYAGTDVTWFDPARCDGRGFRLEKSIDEKRFVIAQVGVRDWKGWKELVDSVSDVVPRHSDVQLLLIGCRNAEESRAVAEYATAAGIGSVVTPVEYRADMPEVLAACDVVVDASWAGTGITGTIREAMAMQKPVVATNAGGNMELVTSPAVGWLVPMRDREALTAALLEILGDRERAASVGRAAREHVVRGYSKELRIDRLEDLYLRILKAKGRTGESPGRRVAESPRRDGGR